MYFSFSLMHVVLHAFSRNNGFILLQKLDIISYLQLLMLFFFFFFKITVSCSSNEDKYYPAGNYKFKFNNRNTGTRWQTCSKLTKKSTRAFFHSVSMVNFEQVNTNCVICTFLQLPNPSSSTKFNLMFPAECIFLIYNLIVLNKSSAEIFQLIHCLQQFHWFALTHKRGGWLATDFMKRSSQNGLIFQVVSMGQ